MQLLQPLPKLKINSVYKDFFDEQVEEWLSKNCKQVEEEYGYDYLDSDVSMAREEIKHLLQEFINEI